MMMMIEILDLPGYFRIGNNNSANGISCNIMVIPSHVVLKTLKIDSSYIRMV